jgi:hypothetical protein
MPNMNKMGGSNCMLLSLNIINDYFVHFVDLYTNSRPNDCRNECGRGGVGGGIQHGPQQAESTNREISVNDPIAIRTKIKISCKY